jgi:hypothetical protein
MSDDSAIRIISNISFNNICYLCGPTIFAIKDYKKPYKIIMKSHLSKKIQIDLVLN